MQNDATHQLQDIIKDSGQKPPIFIQTKTSNNYLESSTRPIIRIHKISMSAFYNFPLPSHHEASNAVAVGAIYWYKTF